MAKSLQARRFDLRVSLWNSRQQPQVPSQDTIDRVKVLSPSLADCLLQRTTQDRHDNLDEKTLILKDTLEKFTYGLPKLLGGHQLSSDSILQIVPYLRSSVVGPNTAQLFMQKSQPKLRTIHLFDDDYLFEKDYSNKIIESKVFVKYSQQLHSFTYEGERPVDLIATIDRFWAMSRLKTLKFKIVNIPIELPNKLPAIGRAITWNELTEFSFQNRHGFDFSACYPVLQSLGEMAQLRKLEIKLSFERNPDRSRRPLNLDLMKRFLTREFGKIPKFSKLEVLSFGVEPPPSDPTLDYRFVLDLLAPKLGTSLKKLNFQVPRTLQSASNCILLDYSNEFAQLETLVLKYPHCNLLYKLHNGSEDKRTPCLSLRQLTIVGFNRNTLSLNSIFEQIPTIFPNLVELNLDAQKRALGEAVFANISDQDTIRLISRLEHLRILRFMDDHSPKLTTLYGSIDLMCKRATELKPQVPMLFRVPILDNDLKYLKFVADQMPDEMKGKFFCWEKADKWIRLY